jgi:hypothetical protein
MKKLELKNNVLGLISNIINPIKCVLYDDNNFRYYTIVTEYSFKHRIRIGVPSYFELVYNDIQSKHEKD